MRCIPPLFLQSTKQFRRLAALAVWLLITASIPAISQEQSRLDALLGRVVGAVKNEIDSIRSAAVARYDSVPRKGTCADRRAQIQSILPDAIRFSRLARDIYSDGHDREMAGRHLFKMDISPGRLAYRDPSGKYYAEVRADIAHEQTVIVFRGTRILVSADVYTDLASYFGRQTHYYEWAADLASKVVGEHAGQSVVATGESLGGGLTLYAVLRNPGLIGFAFNPAGLSHAVWANASPTDRARTNRTVTVVSTRNAAQIEPITSLALAGGSVLPGHLFVIPTNIEDERVLHGPDAVVHALENLESTNASGTACDGDIGVLGK